MQARGFKRAARRPWGLALLLAALMALLAACSDSPSPAPTIGVQPSDTSAVAGTAATLSVSASGPDIAYQWQASTDGGTSWTDVAGATQASYTTPPTLLADSGKRYRVVVTAAGISLNSSAVQLTVTAAVVAPALTVQPVAQTTTAPAPAAFSVTASGTAPAYQWQRSTDGGASFASIAGATAASYGSGATTTAMNGERYRVVVSNSAGSVTSSAAVLAVNPTPVAAAFTTQPANQSVTAGSAAAFTVVATGTPAPTLQWQRSTDGGASFADIAGAIDAAFNTGLTALSQGGERYRAVASNSAGTATSIAATLSVNAAAVAPIITTNPTAQSVTAPATATFGAAATGVPTPTWQWQLSSDSGATFANIVGATGASYTTPATGSADSGKRFRAIASNSAGSATTSAVVLTVTAPVNRMLSARVNHSVTRLADGKLLVAGGVVNSSSGGFFSSVESFDPAATTWSAVARLNAARGFHTTTLLADGRVLVVGGLGVNPGGGAPLRLATAELYDPASNVWSAVGGLATARAHHTATLLADGRVLVAGGSSNNGNLPLASAEVFDPATLAWSDAGTFPVERSDHAAIRLPDGRVLLAGGGNNISGSLASTALYDPATNVWSAGASLARARNYFSASLLANGKVLAVGGWDQLGAGVVASAELYDPATNSWTAAGSLAQGRYAHTGTMLPDGRVLIAAGIGASVLATAELYDAAANAWSSAPSLVTARYQHTAAALANGNVVVTGGLGSSGSAPLASAEVFDPPTATWK